MEPMETTQASLDHLTWENPMGEARKDALRLDFDRRLKLEFHGTKVTNDTGINIVSPTWWAHSKKEFKHEED